MQDLKIVARTIQSVYGFSFVLKQQLARLFNILLESLYASYRMKWPDDKIQEPLAVEIVKFVMTLKTYNRVITKA